MLFGEERIVTIDHPRLRMLVDANNPKAIALAKKFKKYEGGKDQNIYAVFGGDGFMLDSLLAHVNTNLPFLGFNAGHTGFLLNNPSRFVNGIPRKLKLYTLPVLDVEITLLSGDVVRTVGFNDVWVQVTNGQAGWFEVKVNGKVRLKKLVADKVLVATPTGSTAYADKMGALPVPLEAQVLVLAGLGIFSPVSFRPCNLPIWSEIEISTIGGAKRPVIGFVDGRPARKIAKIRVSVSKTRSVQLASVGRNSLPEKLLGIQFPKQK